MERKTRRTHNNMLNTKQESGMDDAVALLNHLTARNHGPLDREYVRSFNVCSAEMLPDNATMDEIAAAYRKKYNDEAFA